MSLAKFIHQAYALKHLKRQGWVLAGHPAPESVAAHSWGLCLLILKLAPPNIDVLKALKLAIVHDLPEVIAGDITPHDGISKADKKNIELEAAKELLPAELLSLWIEYSEKQSPEARFVGALDKLDMGFQAQLYEREIDTASFMDSAQAKLPPELQGLLHPPEHS